MEVNMESEELYACLLDSLRDPLLFADTDHLIRYLNRAATEHYTGGSDLLGRSLLDCHNPESQRQMIAILKKMHTGLDEELITDQPDKRIYMRAVRDSAGRLLGYYERYEYPFDRD
ncbi:MAG: PAS domain-containing protein [Candidatus Neomarinimicrobiota bacterium]